MKTRAYGAGIALVVLAGCTSTQSAVKVPGIGCLQIQGRDTILVVKSPLQEGWAEYLSQNGQWGLTSAVVRVNESFQLSGKDFSETFRVSRVESNRVVMVVLTQWASGPWPGRSVFGRRIVIAPYGNCVETVRGPQ